jgi:hypothetical protein
MNGFLSACELYHSSNDLTSITIYNTCLPGSKAQSLHQLLGCNENGHNSNKTTPGGLRSLSLSQCLVRLDKLTLPHLSQLTSLTLTRVQHEDLDSDCTPVSSSPHEIWTAFLSSSIRLEELTHDVVTNSLIDYLSSYSGLKKLGLKANGFHNQKASDEAAGQFFNRALPRHMESLEVLNLEAPYAGAWCYTMHSPMLIQKCVKLRYLL